VLPEEIAAVLSETRRVAAELRFLRAVAAILLTADEPDTTIAKQDEADDDMR
jgi:hypothetical protein